MSGDDAVYELTIDLPSIPKGNEDHQIQIPGLGTFENGRTYEVSKEQAEAFRAYHTVQESVVDEDTGAYLGSDAKPGPTLLEAAKSMYGVTVETVKPHSSSSSSSTTASASASASTSTSDAQKNEGGDS